MKKAYLKPIVKRFEITGSESLMDDVSLPVKSESTAEEVDKFEDLLGNSTNVWEEE